MLVSGYILPPLTKSMLSQDLQSLQSNWLYKKT